MSKPNLNDKYCILCKDKLLKYPNYITAGSCHHIFHRDCLLSVVFANHNDIFDIRCPICGRIWRTVETYFDYYPVG